MWISAPVVEGVNEALGKGEQALLFLNRRGYAPLTLCRACGHRFNCPQCTAYLVEHRLRGRLICHHCGFFVAIPKGLPLLPQRRIACRFWPGDRAGSGRGWGSAGLRRETCVLFERPRADNGSAAGNTEPDNGWRRRHYRGHAARVEGPQFPEAYFSWASWTAILASRPPTRARAKRTFSASASGDGSRGPLRRAGVAD